MSEGVSAQQERVAWTLLENLLGYLPSIRTWTGGVVAQAGGRGPVATAYADCRRCKGRGFVIVGRGCPYCHSTGLVPVDAYTGEEAPTDTPSPRALALDEIDRELARLEGRTGKDSADQRDGYWRHGSFADVAVELRALLADDRPGVAYAAWCVWAYVVCDQEVPLHDSTIRTIHTLIRLLALRVLVRTGRLDLPEWLQLDPAFLELQRQRFMWRGHGPAADRARSERDEEMRQLRRSGMDVGEIGRRFGLSRSRAYEIVKTTPSPAVAVPTVAA